MNYFGGRRDPKQSSRDAIVTLRQQLQMIEKKEEHLNQRRDAETKTAKDNAVTNKNGEHLPAGISSLPCPIAATMRRRFSCIACHTARCAIESKTGTDVLDADIQLRWWR